MVIPLSLKHQKRKQKNKRRHPGEKQKRQLIEIRRVRGLIDSIHHATLLTKRSSLPDINIVRQMSEPVANHTPGIFSEPMEKRGIAKSCAYS